MSFEAGQSDFESKPTKISPALRDFIDIVTAGNDSALVALGMMIHFQEGSKNDPYEDIQSAQGKRIESDIELFMEKYAKLTAADKNIARENIRQRIDSLKNIKDVQLEKLERDEYLAISRRLTALEFLLDRLEQDKQS